MNLRNKLILFFGSSVLVVIIDWYTKFLAKKYLFYIRSKSYLNDHFVLDYAENNGAALSFGSKLPANQAVWVLEILPSAILLLMLFYTLKNLKNMKALEIIAFAGIFAGGFANLTDRILNNRHVVDFMIIHFGGLQTGIFNFADVFISIGAICLILKNIFQKSN